MHTSLHGETTGPLQVTAHDGDDVDRATINRCFDEDWHVFVQVQDVSNGSLCLPHDRSAQRGEKLE